MFCTNCGTKNADGAKFCTGCGAPLTPSASVSDNQQQVPAPQPVRRAQEAPIAEGRPPAQPDSPSAEQPQPKRKKSKARIVIPVLAVVIIVAAVAVAAVFTNGFGLLGVPVRATVDDYSWDELSKISAQISAKRRPSRSPRAITSPIPTARSTALRRSESSSPTAQRPRFKLLASIMTTSPMDPEKQASHFCSPMAWHSAE